MHEGQQLGSDRPSMSAGHELNGINGSLFRGLNGSVHSSGGSALTSRHGSGANVAPDLSVMGLGLSVRLSGMWPMVQRLRIIKRPPTTCCHPWKPSKPHNLFTTATIAKRFRSGVCESDDAVFVAAYTGSIPLDRLGDNRRKSSRIRNSRQDSSSRYGYGAAEHGGVPGLLATDFPLLAKYFGVGVETPVAVTDGIKAGDAGAFDGFTVVDPSANKASGSGSGSGNGQGSGNEYRPSEQPLVTPHATPTKAGRIGGSRSSQEAPLSEPLSEPLSPASSPASVAHPSTPPGRGTARSDAHPTTPPTTPTHNHANHNHNLHDGHEQLLRQFTVLASPDCLWNTVDPTTGLQRNLLLLVVYKQVGKGEVHEGHLKIAFTLCDLRVLRDSLSPLALPLRILNRRDLDLQGLPARDPGVIDPVHGILGISLVRSDR